MAADSTKERILDISLQLFSQYGFSAVSIRDICGQVHIKESSVYYHFTNKRAILEELGNRFEMIAGGLMQRLDDAVAQLQGEGGSGISGSAAAKVFFHDYLMDDFCNRYIRLLHMERSGSEAMRQTYEKWIFEEPLRFQERIFNALIEKKWIPAADGEYLALKYYAPIYLFFQRYLLGGELTEAKKKLFLEKAEGHITEFFKEMGGV